MTKEAYGVDQYIAQLQHKLPAITKFVQESQALYHTRMERTARNLNRKLRLFKVGDLVKLFKKPNHKKIAKLGRKWQGPYTIVKITEDGGNMGNPAKRIRPKRIRPKRIRPQKDLTQKDLDY